MVQTDLARLISSPFRAARRSARARSGNGAAIRILLKDSAGNVDRHQIGVDWTDAHQASTRAERFDELSTWRAGNRRAARCPPGECLSAPIDQVLYDEILSLDGSRRSTGYPVSLRLCAAPRFSTGSQSRRSFCNSRPFSHRFVGRRRSCNAAMAYGGGLRDLHPTLWCQIDFWLVFSSLILVILCAAAIRSLQLCGYWALLAFLCDLCFPRPSSSGLRICVFSCEPISWLISCCRMRRLRTSAAGSREAAIMIQPAVGQGRCVFMILPDRAGQAPPLRFRDPNEIAADIVSISPSSEPDAARPGHALCGGDCRLRSSAAGAIAGPPPLSRFFCLLVSRIV